MPSRPSRPRILVTNDDGIYSEGLLKLADALREVGDVVIVAPDREQSAASHALTLNRPLRLIQIEEDRYVVDGTPTDCVTLARLGKRIYPEGVIERLDPRGRKYYWIGGEPPHWHPGEGTDFEALQSGFVSITPLHLDLTHHESIQRLKPLEELLGHTSGG